MPAVLYDGERRGWLSGYKLRPCHISDGASSITLRSQDLW